jgi:hypothetical protein
VSGEIRRIEIVFSGYPNQAEQRITSGIRQRPNARTGKVFDCLS